MGWFGKITFGTLGLFLGGPLGAIAGAAMGHLLVDKGINAAGQAIDSTREPRLGQAEQTQATYFISLFSILGKLSKIDGAVTREEIAVVDGFINGLPMADREKQFARQIFNEAKDSRYPAIDRLLRKQRSRNSRCFRRPVRRNRLRSRQLRGSYPPQRLSQAGKRGEKRPVSVHPPLSQMRIGATLLIMRISWGLLSVSSFSCHSLIL